MKLSQLCGRLTLVGLLCLVAACGGGSGGSSAPPGPAQVSTLAYVVTRCHEEKGGAGWSGSQALWVRQGDREPVKVAEFASGQPPIGGFCRLYANARSGNISTVTGVFQRLGVSDDGSLVLFEVTDAFSPNTHVLSPEQQGIFAVRADGSGLRRVADHSNDPAFRVDWRCAFPNAPECTGFAPPAPLQFSPDGRRVAYTDLGPSDTGDEAPQVFTLDLSAGKRQQVTALPLLPECHGHSDDPPDCVQPGVLPVSAPAFVDDTTVTYKRGGGSGNAGGGVFTVGLNADGTPQGEPQAVPVVAAPGGALVPVFEITGAEIYAMTVPVPGQTPVNGGTTVQEIFVAEPASTVYLPEGRVLQLTNYGRSDTTSARVTIDGQHVFHKATADPFGTNPSKQCQFFSTDRLGGDLRQLTSFAVVGGRSRNCEEYGSPGCTVLAWPLVDRRTGSLAFDSNCDPLVNNPGDGDQLFAMRPDGSGLRQLTDTQGIIDHPDRSIDVELPGPWAVPAKVN